MPNVPDFRDLARAKRLAANSRLSFKSVVNGGSPASPSEASYAPASEATPAQPSYIFVDQNDQSIIIDQPDTANYVVVDDTIYQFALQFDGFALGVNNIYDANNFSNCRLEISYNTLQLSANNNTIYVTNSALLSSVENKLYTLFYLNTGSAVIGFAGGGGFPSPSLPGPVPAPAPVKNNYVYGAGRNNYGQLGINGFNDVTVPALLNSAGNFTIGEPVAPYIRGGIGYTKILSGSKLFAAGRNDYGQLGLGYTSLSVTPFKQLSGDWSFLACGGYHTVALSAGTAGQWYAWGLNDTGQLGLGGSIGAVSATSPTLIPGSWSTMQCGNRHTIALSSNTFAMHGCGDNNFGQLSFAPSVPYSTAFRRISGEWSRFATGFSHTFALSAGTGNWYATGLNYTGQLGLGDNNTRYQLTPLTGSWGRTVGFGSSVNFVCGNTHTMGLSATPGSPTFRWLATGQNNFGQLGVGDFVNRNYFVPVDDVVIIDGNFVPNANYAFMFCGENHTVAMSAQNAIRNGLPVNIVVPKIFACGWNGKGQLGLGNKINRTSFAYLTGSYNAVHAYGDNTALLESTVDWRDVHNP